MVKLKVHQMSPKHHDYYHVFKLMGAKLHIVCKLPKLRLDYVTFNSTT